MAALVGLSTGCVDRRFVIESDPTNANVFVNNRYVGATPVNLQFVYYGKYRFVFDRDGYQRLTVEEDIAPPWYEWFPLDFISENLIPYTIRDIRKIQRPLEPVMMVPPETILNRALQLQLQGHSIGEIPYAPPVVVPGQ